MSEVAKTPETYSEEDGFDEIILVSEEPEMTDSFFGNEQGQEGAETEGSDETPQEKELDSSETPSEELPETETNGSSETAPRELTDGERYHQGRADKAEQENKILLAEMAKLDDVKKIDAYLRENPDAIDYIRQHSEGATVTPKEDPAPKRPEAFDPYEAVTPGTESYRYTQELRAYEMAQVRRETRAEMEEMMSNGVGGLRQELEQEKRTTQMRQNFLAAGVPEDQLEAFQNWKPTLEDIVGAYGKANGKDTVKTQATAKSKDELQRMRENSEKAVGAAAIKGEAPKKEVSADKGFLMGLGKAKRSWK